MNNPYIQDERKKLKERRNPQKPSVLAATVVSLTTIILAIILFAGVHFTNIQPRQPLFVYFLGIGLGCILEHITFRAAQKQSYQYHLSKYMFTKRYRLPYKPYIETIKTNTILTPIATTLIFIIVMAMQYRTHMMPAYILIWAFSLIGIAFGHISGYQLFKQEDLDPECLPQTQGSLEKRDSVIEQLYRAISHQWGDRPLYEVLNKNMRETLVYANYLFDFVPYDLWKDLYIEPRTFTPTIKKQLRDILIQHNPNPDKLPHLDRYLKQAKRFNATNYQDYGLDVILLENSFPVNNDFPL